MFTTLFVEPLFNILFIIYGLLPGHDFGVAVICLTILVRLALWPLVTRQLHSQRMMQQMAPEIARIRKETEGDREKQTQMLMELYKERGTSPFAPLLPILIQLPIFFALYIVFRDSVHPEKLTQLLYPWVEQIPAVANVIANNSQFSPTLFGLVNLTQPSLVLAVLAGAAQWYQTKMLQPKVKSEDPQARMMQTMTKVFPILTVVIGLTLPSALALYWAVTSAVAILQQHLVLNRDAREMEEIKSPAITAPKSVTTVSGKGEDAVKITQTTVDAPAGSKKPKKAKGRKKRGSA
ncbi:membrane protein insertase YidC [Patescibacteria group bacterium]|nr:MAG: membrane protein insertase YidC [Patescibacteria group bacterium]